MALKRSLLEKEMESEAKSTLVATPEYVAFLLAEAINKSENDGRISKRARYLDLYAECLATVRGLRELKVKP